MTSFEILMPMIKKFLPFAQKRMGFQDPPRLFLKGDPKNAQNPLGKTAHYDPSEMSITVYTTNRHPKDIMRSLSHELVHHAQNCRGEFDKPHEMGDGYAQNDSHMREMEREAYEIGNMCFRDWEDGIKQTIYFEHLQKGDDKMSTKDWKNGEIKSLLSESWGFKMDLSKLNEGNCTGKRDAKDNEKCPKCGKVHNSVAEGKKCPHCEGDAPKSECICGKNMKEEKDGSDGKYSDNDGKAEKCDYVDCEGDEEVNEGGAALRQGNEDRLGQRHAEQDRIHEEDEEVVEEDFPGKREMEQHKADLSEARLRKIIAYALKTKG